MKVSIPYQYDASYVRKGYRNPDTAVQIAEVEVDIPEISTDDAECVFEIGQDIEFKYDSNPFRNVAGEPARVWSHAGKFYVQRERVARMLDLFCNGEHGQGNPFLTSGRLDAPKPFRVSLDHARSQEKTREAVMAEHQIKSWNDDGGVGHADAIRRRAEELAVIDGWLCVPVSEPVLSVGELSKESLEEAHEPAIYLFLAEAVPGEASSFDHFRGVDQGDYFRRFALTDSEAARNYGEAFAKASQVPFVEAARIDRIDPDHVAFRSEAEAVGSAARLAVAGLTDQMAELPAKAGLAARALKEAVIDAGNTLVTPAMVYGLERLIECLPAEDDPWYAMEPQRNWWRSEGRIENWGDPERTMRYIDIIKVSATTALDMWLSKAPGGQWVQDALPVPCHFDGRTTVSQILTRNEASRFGAELGFDALDLVVLEQEAGNVVVSIVEERRSAIAVLAASPSGYEVREPVGEGGRKAPWAHMAAETFARSAELTAGYDPELDLAGL